MAAILLAASEAANRLGIARSTLYSWLSQSDAGTFMIRGRPETICYFQTGQRGQGRIKIDAREVERLLSLMRVTPKQAVQRIPTTKKKPLYHITATLGRPDD